MADKAEKDAQSTVAKAQDEIRAERDRVFQELQRQVADLSVQLAGVVVGQELDASRHEKLIDDYVKQVSNLGSGNGSDN
jgi:F-type H+-transporting ATPase subunit b